MSAEQLKRQNERKWGGKKRETDAKWEYNLLVK